MNETFCEYCDSSGLAIKVDRTQAVIRGVKILGVTSRNGRTYSDDTIAQAASLYEEAKVNVNHPKTGLSAPRDYQDRIGAMRGVTARPGEGLFADFHYNPKHALAEQLAWDAEHAPENVGFSHNVEARTARRGDHVVVEAITKVQSVDLVADPATTRGLYESANGTSKEIESVRWSDLTLDTLRTHRADIIEQLERSFTDEKIQLEAELERLRTAQALADRKQTVRKLLAEYRLPDPDANDRSSQSIVDERFLQTLFEAEDESAIRERIEERATLVRNILERESNRSESRPLSRDQNQIDTLERTNVDSFVQSIT